MRSFFYNLTAGCAITLALSCNDHKKAVGNNAYTINPGVSKIIDQKKRPFDGVLAGSMDFKLIENDSVIGNTYSIGKPMDGCVTKAILKGDTIHLIGYPAMLANIGFKIALVKDTCMVVHFAKSDEEVYRLKETDPLQTSIEIPCTSYKLTLVEKPTFKPGEVISGIIELTSEDYYEMNEGREKKDKVQLTSYFVTEPLDTVTAK